MARMISRWLRWLLGGAADWLIAVWLIIGLAAIIFLLPSSPLLCIVVAAAFVGVTLFAYFRIPRAR